MANDTSQPPWLQPPPIMQAQKKLGVMEDDMEYGERLIHYTYATQHDDIHFLEYRSLHRLNLFCLQNRLAKLKGCYLDKVNVSDEESVEIENTLHRYSKCCDSLPTTNHLLYSDTFSARFPVANSSAKPTQLRITPTWNP